MLPRTWVVLYTLLLVWVTIQSLQQIQIIQWQEVSYARRDRSRQTFARDKKAILLKFLDKQPTHYEYLQPTCLQRNAIGQDSLVSTCHSYTVPDYERRVICLGHGRRKRRKTTKRESKKCPFHSMLQGNYQYPASIGKCPAINAIMRAGYVVYAPADFKVHTNGDGHTILFTQLHLLHLVLTTLFSMTPRQPSG